MKIDTCPSERNVCRSDRQWRVTELQRRLGEEDWLVWQEGNQLTFAYRGKFTQIYLGGAIQSHLTPVADSDFWVLTVRIHRLDEAIVRHWLYAFDDQQQIVVPATVGVWRGEQAPAPPSVAELLEGEIRELELFSTALNEQRRVTCYLPPGYSKSQANPVVYMTDGDQLIDFGFAHVVEPLILRGNIPPVVLVAVHAAPSWSKSDRRAEEYLLGVNEKAYAEHEVFFTETVRAWAESELNVTRDPKQRALMGYSHGAVFAGNTGVRRPNIYGNVMMFSPGIELVADESTAIAARYYLLAGTLEEEFYAATERSYRKLKRANVEAVFNQQVAGHASTMWVEAFPRALQWTCRVK